MNNYICFKMEQKKIWTSSAPEVKPNIFYPAYLNEYDLPSLRHGFSDFAMKLVKSNTTGGILFAQILVFTLNQLLSAC